VEAYGKVKSIAPNYLNLDTKHEAAKVPKFDLNALVKRLLSLLEIERRFLTRQS